MTYIDHIQTNPSADIEIPRFLLDHLAARILSITITLYRALFQVYIFIISLLFYCNNNKFIFLFITINLFCLLLLPSRGWSLLNKVLNLDLNMCLKDCKSADVLLKVISPFSHPKYMDLHIHNIHYPVGTHTE